MKEPQTNYLVTLCYGYDRVFYEWAYGLLSLGRMYSTEELANTEIWIYTDKPEWFSDTLPDCPLNLRYRKIDNATIQRWRGPADFVHRVKIEVLKDITAGRIGNFLYVDTDTVFTSRIDKVMHGISEGGLCMHVMEGIIKEQGNPVLKKLDNYLQQNDKKLNGQPLRDMAMWNAGVLGFNSDHAYLLDEVLAFTDAEYPLFPKHIIEQFAFSVFFQQTAEIQAAEPYMFHYWNLKEAQIVLRSFFEYFKGNSWSEMTKYSTLIQMSAMMQDKETFLKKRGVLASMLNKQWMPVKPDWVKLVEHLW